MENNNNKNLAIPYVALLCLVYVSAGLSTYLYAGEINSDNLLSLRWVDIQWNNPSAPLVFMDANRLIPDRLFGAAAFLITATPISWLLLTTTIFLVATFCCVTAIARIRYPADWRAQFLCLMLFVVMLAILTSFGTFWGYWAIRPDTHAFGALFALLLLVVLGRYETLRLSVVVLIVATIATIAVFADRAHAATIVAPFVAFLLLQIPSAHLVPRRHYAILASALIAGGAIGYFAQMDFSQSVWTLSYTFVPTRKPLDAITLELIQMITEARQDGSLALYYGLMLLFAFSVSRPVRHIAKSSSPHEALLSGRKLRLLALMSFLGAVALTTISTQLPGTYRVRLHGSPFYLALLAATVSLVDCLPNVDTEKQRATLTVGLGSFFLAVLLAVYANTIAIATLGRTLYGDLPKAAIVRPLVADLATSVSDVVSKEAQGRRVWGLGPYWFTVELALTTKLPILFLDYDKPEYVLNDFSLLCRTDPPSFILADAPRDPNTRRDYYIEKFGPPTRIIELPKLPFGPYPSSILWYEPNDSAKLAAAQLDWKNAIARRTSGLPCDTRE